MALHVEEIESIGAVDSGDNPGSFIAFWKRKKKASAVSAETTQGTKMDTFDVTALPEDAQTHIADIQKNVDDSAATIEALEAKVAELTPTVEDTDTVDVEKASAEVQTLIAKLREDNDAQAEQLAVEVIKRRDSDFVAKARKEELDVLLGNAEEIGPVLRELSDAAPEAYAKIEPALVAAAQRANGFFKELGANDGDADPQGQKATWISKQKQDGSEKTDAELAVAFWAAHPDAVAAERENK